MTKLFELMFCGLGMLAAGSDPVGPYERLRAALDRGDPALAALVKDAWKAEDPDDLLQKYAFLKIIINPEGRVKVERGPLVPILEAKKARLGLVRVHNQSGGQPPLEAKMHYFGSDKNPFRIAVVDRNDFSGQLSGGEVEYKLLLLECNQPGKREVTIGFQAGKMTQDLGFRGEVPVLFEVR